MLVGFNILVILLDGWTKGLKEFIFILFETFPVCLGLFIMLCL